jgi:hypothetical protein
MSKKHFIDLADTLIQIHDSSDMGQDDWDMLMNNMVSFCKRNGKNFDEQRFRYYIESRVTVA